MHSLYLRLTTLYNNSKMSGAKLDQQALKFYQDKIEIKKAAIFLLMTKLQECSRIKALLKLQAAKSKEIAIARKDISDTVKKALITLTKGEAGQKFTDSVPFKDTVRRVNLSDIIEYS